MLTNIKYIVCTLWSIEEFALTSLMIRLDGFLCLPWHFFAQLPLGFLLCSRSSREGFFSSKPSTTRHFFWLVSLNRRWALALRCCSSRKGFSFLLPEQKKRNKENSPSALFCLLQSGIPLKKKNSLRSNSFFFLTLHPAPSASRQKSEAGPLCFLVQHRFARWGVMFSFFASLFVYHIPR